MSTLKVGVLGCGKMGKVYARWFSRNPGTEVVAAFNRTYSRTVELAGEYPGLRPRKSWQEITTDPDIDIVGICTPSHEHLEQMESAVGAGKHVLCEKPMAKNHDECRRMCDLAAGSPGKVAVGFQMRFHPVIRKVDELLPRIGKVFHVDFVFGMYRPEITWRHKRIQGGGVLKELGSHLVDLGAHWAGDVASVSAHNRIISPPREVEDYSVNLLEFAGGATGYLSCNYFDRRSRAIVGYLLGSEGQICWQFGSYDPDDSRLTLYTNAGKQDVSIALPAEHDTDAVYPGHLDSFRLAIDHFVECIQNDSQPVAGVVEGAKALEVIDASYESARQGRRIELPRRGPVGGT